MKSLIFLFLSIVIAITLTSGTQKTIGNTKSITLQSVTNNAGSALLKQSADIISSRLKLFGLSSVNIKVEDTKGQIKILLPENIVISEVERILTLKGELAFFETYTHNEILDLLKPDNQLFKLLGHDQEQRASDPRVGCTSIENREKTDEYLGSSVPVKNCKLYWGFVSEKSGLCLFALKTKMDGKPLLERSDVESVKIVTDDNKQNTKIRIKLKPEAVKIFADATRNNLNKSIAIVIDNEVYSWPVVRSVIEGGEVEVTGEYTSKEASSFPVIFNTEELPLSFKLVK
jgi:SecD/SecF fusion protein